MRKSNIEDCYDCIIQNKETEKLIKTDLNRSVENSS